MPLLSACASCLTLALAPLAGGPAPPERPGAPYGTEVPSTPPANPSEDVQAFHEASAAREAAKALARGSGIKFESSRVQQRQRPTARVGVLAIACTVYVISVPVLRF